MKITWILSLILFSLNLHAMAELTLTPSLLVSGKTTQIKIMDGSVDVTGQYSITSSDVSIVSFGSRPYAIGKEAGEEKEITATHSDPSKTKIFKVKVVPGQATKILIDSGNNQRALVGTLLPLPLKVKVVDRFNNGVAGVVVNLSSSLAQLSDAQITTGPDGVASSTVTLGSKVGLQFVEAKSAIQLSQRQTVWFSFEGLSQLDTDPKKIVITSSPSSVNRNEVFSVSASIYDNTGALVLSPKNVTIEAFKNSSCATPSSVALSGTKQKTSSDGTVIFNDLSYNKSEYIYLGVKIDGLNIACSQKISVKETSGLHSLAFKLVPSSGIQGKLLSSVSVSLAKENGYFYRIPTQVTISAHADSSCSAESVVQMNGTLTRTSSLGTASFSGLSINSPGTYYIKASAAGAAGVVSVCSSSLVISPNPNLSQSSFAVTGVSISEDGKVVTISGSSLTSVQSVKFLEKNYAPIDTLVIVSKEAQQVVAKPSKNFTINSQEIILRVE